MQETVGFIGLGVMGRPMAKHILAKGIRVVVHNRSRGAVDELVAAGATAREQPRRSGAAGDASSSPWFRTRRMSNAS